MTTVDLDPRRGPRAKIERAKEHLAEFDREINAFIDSKPYKFISHFDPDGTHHVILKSHTPMPIRFSTLIGDVVHNARSALDLLCTCAARLETKNLENFKFPIFWDRVDFEEKACKKGWEHCPRTVRFLKLLKPYGRGYDLGHHGHTLVILNRLDTRDKHELIIPLGTTAKRAIVTPGPGYGEPFELVPPDTALLNDGEIIMSFSRTDPLFANKKFKTDITTQIRLSGVNPLPTVGASATLHHIVKIVDRIIGIAERTLFRSNVPLIRR